MDNTATLSWTAINAYQCKIDPGIGYVDASGAVDVQLSGADTYEITAMGPGGFANAVMPVHSNFGDIKIVG